MKENRLLKPDYIFEVSWEVCNKIGGIYTVVSTKALTLVQEYKDRLVLIGPDVWKEAHDNPDFIEDKFLYRSWREHAERKGFRLKIGRWNIAGKPIAILVDFTTFINKKDDIFARFWEKYHLDSISGQWDFVEPTLFGYAAAKLIENFYDYNNSSHDRIVAQFHEWMTGTGVLYLNDKVPQIGTMFTTHATVVGRCIAGNGLPLYEQLESYNGDEISHRFWVVAKQSLEKTTADVCDAFTTVSDITARECAQFLEKPVDLVTPNGFEDSFVPDREHFIVKRTEARNNLIKVTEALLNQPVSEDAMLIATSGRYEFKNKGIDVYINSLAKLNQSSKLNKQIIAFIFVPANNYGFRKDVVERLANTDFNAPFSDTYLTHHLHDEEFDPSIKLLREKGLRNLPTDKVKVVFVPSYLNGNDGVFNMSYYDILIGLDVTVFPSYYEPYGYTPLESLAFRIPTITTSLSGFGILVRSVYGNAQEGVMVIERNDTNDEEVAVEIANKLLVCSSHSKETKAQICEQSFHTSRIALWKNLIKYYEQAYSIALEKVAGRYELYADKKQPDQLLSLQKQVEKTKPIWRRVSILPDTPENLTGLREIANNLWWSWNPEAIDLFESIDKELWKKVNENPVALLNGLYFGQLQKLVGDEKFMQKLDSVYKKFQDYMQKPAKPKAKEMVAYFSMEFGLHDSIKIFSGGLGILAGDYLKEASDCNVNIVGVGLLYRFGYFAQQLSLSGEQISVYDPQSFSQLPIHPERDSSGKWRTISIAFPGRTVFARIWRVDIGRIPLYLLDTDFDANTDQDKSITHQLYGGDWENRLKQELLLGVGGIRMLDALGLNPSIYHINEGHAAFLGIERLRKIIRVEKYSFSEALEIVKGSTLFTTHTPVPAGHDAFSENLLRTYIPHYAEMLNLTWNEFINLGKMVPNNPEEKFSMSHLAAKTAGEINGVSRIHGRVSRDMFKGLYEGYFSEEMDHINYVTNGVHYPFWTSKRWRNLYETEFDPCFLSDQSNNKWWKKIHDVSDEKIWEIRQAHRKELVEYAKDRMIANWTKRYENPMHIIDAVNMFDENALTIGFARRFATYKRAHLLFTSLDRLTELLNIKGKPLQIIFAGKAHPKDTAGQELIKRIFEITRMPEFFGKIIFIENYDIALAKKLVQGVDIWLNNPTRPQEASGTSGEKAIMNGVLNLSVLDGWWAEGYMPKAGWAIKEEKTYENQELQNQLDAITIYNIIEQEIIPAFYNRDEKGIPHEFVGFIKNSIAQIAPRFNMKRMLDDYRDKYYDPLIKRNENLSANDFQLAKDLAAWKKKIHRGWQSIEVVSVNFSDTTNKPLKLGEDFIAEVVIDVNELSVEDYGVEVLFVESTLDDKLRISYKKELDFIKIEDEHITYKAKIPSGKAGIFNFGFRIFPKNKHLAHRQDCSLIKWI